LFSERVGKSPLTSLFLKRGTVSSEAEILDHLSLKKRNFRKANLFLNSNTSIPFSKEELFSEFLNPFLKKRGKGRFVKW